MLVGGVQDRYNANSIQLLFYKTDRQNNPNESGANYNLKVVSMDSKSQPQDFERLLNTMQLENFVIRSVIHFSDSLKS